MVFCGVVCVIDTNTCGGDEGCGVLVVVVAREGAGWDCAGDDFSCGVLTAVGCRFC